MSIILSQSEYQRLSDGYINATKLCQIAGKRINNYLRAYETKKFLQVLSSDTQKSATDLVIVIQGGDYNLQGTWVHPRVAVHLGQWLSPEFAVLVSQWVIDWMSGHTQPKQKQILSRPVLPVLLPAKDYYPAAIKHGERLPVIAERKEHIKVLQENQKLESFLDANHHSGWTYREILENFLDAMDILLDERLIGDWNYRKYWYELDFAVVRTYWVAIAHQQEIWGIFTNRYDVPYVWSDIEEITQTVGKGLKQKENFTTTAINAKWIKKECLILSVGNSFYIHEDNDPNIYQKRSGRRIGYKPGFAN